MGGTETEWLNVQPSFDADIIVPGHLCDICGVGASSEEPTFDAAIRNNPPFFYTSLVILLLDVVIYAFYPLQTF